MLVDFLAQQGIIPEDLRRQVVRKGSEEAHETLRVLLGSRAVDPNELAETLAQFADVPFVALASLPPVSRAVVDLVPAELIGTRGVLPLGFSSDGVLYFGCLYPLDQTAMRLVAFFSGSKVCPVVISANAMADALTTTHPEGWPDSWRSLLGQHRGRRATAQNTRVANTVIDALREAIQRPVEHQRVPMHRDAQKQPDGGLERYFEFPSGEAQPAVEAAEDSSEEGLQEAFRQASKPGGYHTVQSGAYRTIDVQRRAKQRVEGFFGSVPAILSRSRETNRAASEAFSLAAHSSPATGKALGFYAQVIDALSVVYPIVTLWIVRGSELLLADCAADAIDPAAHRGTRLPNERGPWERVARTGLGYRGRITRRDEVSRWLADRGAHHVWIAPGYVADRLTVLLGVCTVPARKMQLPSLASYEAFDRAFNAALTAGASSVPAEEVVHAAER